MIRSGAKICGYVCVDLTGTSDASQASGMLVCSPWQRIFMGVLQRGANVEYLNWLHNKDLKNDPCFSTLRYGGLLQQLLSAGHAGRFIAAGVLVLC